MLGHNVLAYKGFQVPCPRAIEENWRMRLSMARSTWAPGMAYGNVLCSWSLSQELQNTVYCVFVRAVVSLFAGRTTMPCKQRRHTRRTLSSVWHTLSSVQMSQNLNQTSNLKISAQLSILIVLLNNAHQVSHVS